MRRTKDKDKLTRLKVELSDVENKINDSLKQKRDKEEKIVIDKLDKDTKPFFKYAKKMAKTNENVGPLM